MCEEGKIQDPRRLGWPTHDLNNKRMERKMVSRGEGGKYLGIENLLLEKGMLGGVI